MDWTPESWRKKPYAQEVEYSDQEALGGALARLRDLPPLVTWSEVEKLRGELADAEEGRRFLLQGGDCAEAFADCRPQVVASKLKILLQMSLVLVHAARQPVIRVGRFAGQYAKPRSSPTETRDGVTLPSYFGDLVNRPQFEEKARAADPELMITAYQHAALTLNYIRALSDGGFADLHHPEYWELGFLQNANVLPQLRREYERLLERIGEALRFMEALGEKNVGDLSRVEFYTSHEGLNLHYEEAQTSKPRSGRGYYTFTTHLPWIGERTRALTGAHIEFFRGIRNPVGVKLGPSANVEEIVKLTEALNPANESGKMVLITRLGAKKVREVLPRFIDGIRKANRRALFVADPMHGNTHATASGVKTRDFSDILDEVEASFQVHESEGSRLGGVHFELTGDDVTECTGGAVGLQESDLHLNYATMCDPRLNYGQALEMAFRMAARMKRKDSIRPWARISQ